MSQSRFDRTLWLGLLLIVFSGCMSYRIEKPSTLNTELCYLSWRECLAQEGRGSRCQTPVNTVDIQPGMKLVIRSASLLEKAHNLQPPELSTYEWIAPRPGYYDQQDLFFALYLLSAGVPDQQFSEQQPFNGEQYLNDLARGLSDPDFYDKLMHQVLTPALDSLRLVSFRSGEHEQNTCSAREIRKWLTKPGAENFANPGESQQSLAISFPLPVQPPKTVDLELFNWNSGFFHENVGELENARRNIWYSSRDSGIVPSEARSYLSLEIPVRLHPEVVSRYFPIYWSVQDLEARLGVHVRGIRRSGDFLGELPAETRRLCAQKDKMRRECFLAPDRYFTIYFQKSGYGFGAARYLTADESLKNELLLAPRDIVILDLQGQTVDRPEIH